VGCFRDIEEGAVGARVRADVSSGLFGGGLKHQTLRGGLFGSCVSIVSEHVNVLSGGFNSVGDHKRLRSVLHDGYFIAGCMDDVLGVVVVVVTGGSGGVTIEISGTDKIFITKERGIKGFNFDRGGSIVVSDITTESSLGLGLDGVMRHTVVNDWVTVEVSFTCEGLGFLLTHLVVRRRLDEFDCVVGLKTATESAGAFRGGRNGDLAGWVQGHADG
jgi:hypothetical protein